MPNFSDPAFQRRANELSLAKRRAWATLRRMMKSGQLDALAALNHPAAQDRNILDVCGYLFSRTDRPMGSFPQPLTQRAGKALNRVEVNPSLKVRALSPARRRELAEAIAQDPLYALRRPKAAA